MGVSGLPKVGVEAIVENIQKFVKDIDTVNKAVTESGATSAAAAKKAGALPDALGDAGKAYDSIKGKISDFIKQNIPFGNQLGGIVDQLLAIPPPALAAVGAITALIGSFIALGNRGAPLQEIGIAFDHITASIGVNSQKLLKDLQAASEGTIASFDLIKTASNALVGTTGQLGQSLGNTLPQFLKIAKAQADATGRSVNELFNNIVEGVKKGTPKLIESTGLIIDQKKAYQDYAKTLGVTVAQLSDTDRSMALLGATLDAGTVAINALGDASESNADKLDRQQASITNTIDAFAIAVQPAFGVVLDSTQKVLDQFQQLGTALAPIFGGIVSIIANVFSTVVDIITSITQPIVDIISSIAPYFALAFQTVANILGAVGKIISDVVGGIVKFLKDVAKNFFGLDLDNLGPRLFNGAAAAFGSFANGIIAVANKLIFPAVIKIAQFIADFLIGFSPPKLGPLSVIDKGGENLMLSWLDGISGVSLDPVKQVAQQVSDALGSIGKESLVQVNTRLAQLDKALLPFQNRLDIIKANFEALNEPAKAALDAITRESDKLQDAVAQGNPEAIERLKVLDAQREAIQKQVDAQQSLVDGAQIQLGLAQAQQAPERALLTIRQKYLEALAKAQGKTTTGGGGAIPKEKKLPAGSAPIDAAKGGAGLPVAPAGELPSVLDLIGGQDAVDAAAKGLSDSFMGAIDQSGLQEFAQNSLDLGTQIDRIKSVDIGAKITDKFKGLSDAFNPSVAGSVANTVFQFFNGTQDNPNSLAGIINNAGTAIGGVIDNLKTIVQNLLSSIFDPTIDGSPASIVVTLTSGPEVEGSIASFFAKLPDNITAALANLTQFVFNSFNGIISFFTGTGPGTLSGYIDVVVKFFSDLPARLVDALKGIGAAIYGALASPVISVINGLIGLIEEAVKGLINKIAEFVGSIANALGDATPQFLKDTINQLHAAAGGVNFGRIPTALPAFLAPTAPAGAKGGLFGEGLFKVGEKGPEYLFSGQKFGVLPNQLTQVLESLSNVLAQPAPMPIYGGGSSTINNNNSSFTFNGVQGDNDARRRYNYLRAGMR